MSRRVIVDTLAVESPRNPFPGWHLQRELVNCGNCKRCSGTTAHPHGPYWYRYRQGKSRYVGKSLAAAAARLRKLHKVDKPKTRR